MLSALLLSCFVSGCPGFPVGEESDAGDSNQSADAGSEPSRYPAPRDDLTAALGSDTTLDLATWNIENFPKATTTAEFLADLITSMDLDIIGVQEIANENGFQELLDRLPNYDGVLSSHTYSDGSYQKVGFIYKKDVVSLSDTSLIFSGSGYNFPRPPLQTTVSVLDGDTVVRELTLIVLHLKAGVDQESSQRRTDAMVTLEGYLDSQVSGPGLDDIVVLGDFNDVLTNSFGLAVFAPFQTDAYTIHTLELAESGGESYLPSDSILDHIISTSSISDIFNPATIPDFEREFWNYEQTVSDHLPVVISLPNTP